jgi:hypothetical protein
MDDLDRPIWGAREIGKVINRTQSQTFHLLEKKILPGKKIGKLWVSTARMLLKAVLKEGNDEQMEKQEEGTGGIAARLHNRRIRKA